MGNEKKFNLDASDLQGIDNTGSSYDSSDPALTIEEREDVDKIVVNITDSTSPIIILFGARASGKTMTLVRLSRYLKQNKYTVEPVRTFRPSNSKHYEKMCDNFENIIFSNTAAAGTHVLSFMLVKVSKNGAPICQILEAPGEHYFDDKNMMTFPPYIQEIVQNNNPKTWIFIVELDWKDNITRSKYAKKIRDMRNIINAGDKVILMCHKADLKPNYYHKNKLVKEYFYRDIKQQYPDIFTGYMTTNPIKKWFSPYDIAFVVFSAGKFSESRTYVQSNDYFPKELWRNIDKSIKGAWF
jgi:hypothetical protein